MSYLLDTNVISELRKIGDGKADPEVAAWIEAVNAGCAAGFVIVSSSERRRSPAG